MTNDPNRPYADVKPAQGQGESQLDPFEIDFRADFRDNPGPREPFVNAHGVTIGDHDYESPDSPLEQWSRDTDPAIMSGEQWVHPFKDVGFRTRENRDLFERGIAPSSALFMHPVRQTSIDSDPDDDEFFPVPEVHDEP